MLPTYRRHGHEGPTNGDDREIMARGSVQESAVSSLRSRAILMPKAVAIGYEAFQLDGYYVDIARYDLFI